MRLRRVPFGPPRPPHRSYRFGRFSTTPIRLRIIGDEEMIQLTAVLWANWPALVRVVLSLPGVRVRLPHAGPSRPLRMTQGLTS